VGTIVDTGVPEPGQRPEHVAIPTLVVVVGVTPPVGDPAGSGARIVVEVNDTAGILGVLLDGQELVDLTIDDDTHVSGGLPAHAADVVDLVVINGAGPKTIPDAFEYWTPAQIPDIDVYLDAGRNVTLDGNRVESWTDSGPNGRVFARGASPPPVWVEGAFGAAPALRFQGNEMLRLAAPVTLDRGSSIFAVAAWTADTVGPSAACGCNAPLTLVGDVANTAGSFGASAGQIFSAHRYADGSTRAVIRAAGVNDGHVRMIGATVDEWTTTKVFVGNNQVGVDDLSLPRDLGSYDAIGAGWDGADGWDGDVGAVVIVHGEISVAERTKLDLWAQQRFGTPRSAALDPWTRRLVTELPLEWFPRDGAQMVEVGLGGNSRVLMLGGWSPAAPWRDPGTGNTDMQTNEVWESPDGGLAWNLVLGHRSTFPGAPTRFSMGHTVGVAEYADAPVVIGSDPNYPPYLGEVWQGTATGRNWNKVSDTAPSAGRCLFMLGNLGDTLYLMGGQRDLGDTTSALDDVWFSMDGGATWEQSAAEVPWAGRGMVYRPVELDGKLYVVGGGVYHETAPVAYNGVYAFDGTEWDEILPDGHDQFAAAYYTGLAALDGRLWLFNGFTGTEELSRTLVSDDYGETWTEYPGGSGGMASHADAVVAVDDRILRVSGNLDERYVWEFVAPE
jgi:hypothetical protein